RPEPVVTWFNGSQPLQIGNGVLMGRHVTVNRLEVHQLTRDALNNTYRCEASNTKLAPPSIKTVRLEMLLKPIYVNITEKPKMFTSGSEYILTCVVVGSVPDTEIKWMQNNRSFKRGNVSLSTNGSTVTSSLIFHPLPEDDGTILKCEGSNPRLPNSALEDSLVLNVMYPPQVTLSLGSTLKPDDIKEGDDVYFECHIKANPKEHRIIWSHDGVPVTQNVSWGVIISTRSLVLQKVARLHAGLYACSAANDRGETQSALVNLRIRYAPVCTTSTVVVVGASLEESISIPCRVNSDPQEIEFEWTFSSSGEHFEVPSGHYTTVQETSGGTHRTVIESNETHIESYVETVSELVYTPKSERDYGTLACWGKNSIGKQTEPCLFQVVPAAKPASLRNCTLRPYVVTSAASLNSSNAATMHSNGLVSPSSSSSLSSYNKESTNGNHGSYVHSEYIREASAYLNIKTRTKRKRDAVKSGSSSQGRAQKPSTANRRKALGSSNNTKTNMIFENSRPAAPDVHTNEVVSLVAANTTKDQDDLKHSKSNSSYAARSVIERMSKRHANIYATSASIKRDKLRRNAIDNDDDKLDKFKSTKPVTIAEPMVRLYRSNGGVGFPNTTATNVSNSSMSSLHSSSSGSGESSAWTPLVATSPVDAIVPNYAYLKMETTSNGAGGGSNQVVENYENIVYSAIELECVAGYDGGLPQYFVLEAYDSRSKKLRLNMTSTYPDIPLFRIDLTELTPSDSYMDSPPTLHLIAYSVNQKGRSEPIILEDIAINEAEKRTDGAIGLSILPLAALLTGTLLTIGIGVLLVVVIAIRKRREQSSSSSCDDKDKHLGMDVTVTAPLEMGAGHQRFVVAYTLKQGIEKQPDIINAQKDSEQNLAMKQKQNATTPPSGRPNALYLGKQSYTPQNFESPTTIFTETEQQQKTTPSSHHSTLKYKDDGRKTYQEVIYSTLPVKNVLHESILSNSATMLARNESGRYDSPTSNYGNNCNANADLQNNISSHKTEFNKNDEYGLSVADYLGSNLDFSLGNTDSAITMGRVSNPTISSTTISKTNSTRNHIITDTLPGPESCV
ncbi:unnamed protein product, partial [Hermetia illucens]